MKNRLLRCCTLLCFVALCCSPECYGDILYDDLQDTVEVLSFERLGNGSVEMGDDGLNFVSSQASGGVAIGDAEGPFSTSDGWSIRARFTIDEVLGLGLAGVGVEFPQRWAAVLGASHDEEFGVGEGFSPQKVAIEEGDILDDPFVVQLDAFGESLTGHFWRPEAPTDVKTISYRRVGERSVAPRLANNGAGITYHEIWVSRSPLPLPTGFEDQGQVVPEPGSAMSIAIGMFGRLIGCRRSHRHDG